MAPALDVLVIDDDLDYREILGEALRDEGYSVELARDGREGIMVARRALPRVILLDVVMPEMDGTQFLMHQRKDPELANVPVVLISGLRNLMELSTSLEVQGFLAKPPPLDSLLATVARYAGDRGAPSV